MHQFYKEEDRRWDVWKAFHVHANYAFTQFDTGEIICTSGNWNKDQRHKYSALNVSIYDQTDLGMPALFTPSGEPVKTAWFGDVQRTFLIDHQWNRVIEIKNILYRDKDQPDWVKRNVPKRFWGKCSVYWPSTAQEPFGPPTYFTRPRKLTPEERDHISGIRAAIKAQESLGNAEAIPTPTYGPGFKEPVLGEKLLQMHWSDLDTLMKGRIKTNGIVMPTERIEVPYFITKNPPEENGDRDD